MAAAGAAPRALRRAAASGAMSLPAMSSPECVAWPMEIKAYAIRSYEARAQPPRRWTLPTGAANRQIRKLAGKNLEVPETCCDWYPGGVPVGPEKLNQLGKLDGLLHGIRKC